LFKNYNKINRKFHKNLKKNIEKIAGIQSTIQILRKTLYLDAAAAVDDEVDYLAAVDEGEEGLKGEGVVVSLSP
jgi:hypothetical protein